MRNRLDDQSGMFEDLRRAAEVEPGARWIQVELGWAYWLAGRHDEASAALQAVLAQDPTDDIALAGLGAIHRVRKSYEEALHYLDRAVTADPEYAWAYGRRGRVCLAIGRTEQALSDLDRCVALDAGMTWERGAAIELLLSCGRWEEAGERLAATHSAELDDVRAELHRHHGEWAQARALAERLRTTDPLAGTFQLAMTVHRSEGPAAAEPLWRDLSHLVEHDPDMEPVTRAQAHCFLGCVLADGPAADRGLSELLTLTPEWDDLASLADILTELLTAPGADRSSRTAACLTAVSEARDAIQALWSARS